MSEKGHSDRKRSLRGSLKHYAKPALMPQEQNAWQAAVSAKFDYTRWKQATNTDDSIEDISRKAMELRKTNSSLNN